MKHDILLRRCNFFYKAALDVQDLVRQALTDPNAMAALTDYLLEIGEIKPDDNFTNPKVSQEILDGKVAAWIADNYPTAKMRAKDLQPGDIVIEKVLVYGARFRRVESVGLYTESPEYKALKLEEPYYNPDRFIIKFTDGSRVAHAQPSDVFTVIRP